MRRLRRACAALRIGNGDPRHQLGDGVEARDGGEGHALGAVVHVVAPEARRAGRGGTRGGGQLHGLRRTCGSRASERVDRRRGRRRHDRGVGGEREEDGVFRLPPPRRGEVGAEARAQGQPQHVPPAWRRSGPRCREGRRPRQSAAPAVVRSLGPSGAPGAVASVARRGLSTREEADARSGSALYPALARTTPQRRSSSTASVASSVASSIGLRDLDRVLRPNPTPEDARRRCGAAASKRARTDRPDGRLQVHGEPRTCGGRARAASGRPPDSTSSASDERKRVVEAEDAARWSMAASTSPPQVDGQGEHAGFARPRTAMRPSPRRWGRSSRWAVTVERSARDAGRDNRWSSWPASRPETSYRSRRAWFRRSGTTGRSTPWGRSRYSRNSGDERSPATTA